MSDEEQPEPEQEETEEDPGEGGPLAGGCVLITLAGATLGGIYAASPAAAVGAVWLIGTGALWKAAKSVPRAANPAPPPVPEGATDTKPQFTIVEDREGHCIVKWSKRG